MLVQRGIVWHRLMLHCAACISSVAHPPEWISEGYRHVCCEASLVMATMPCWTSLNERCAWHTGREANLGSRSVASESPYLELWGAAIALASMAITATLAVAVATGA